MKDNKNKPESELLIEELRKTRGKIKNQELFGNKIIESEERFKILFDHAPDGYYINDLEGNFIDGNKAVQKITGYQKEELVGKNFFQLDILPSYEISKVQQALARNQQGLTTGPDEFTLNRKDHKKITVEIFTYPLKIKEKPLVLAIARDISKRKRTEKALSERNKELNCLYRISKIKEDPNISVNQVLQSIVELLPSAWQYPEFVCAGIQVNGQNFKTKNFRDTKWKQSVPIIVRNQPVGKLEVCYLKTMSQSEECPFLKEESNLIDALAKSISRFLERKQAEKLLQKSEQRFRVALKNSPIIVWNQDKELRYNWIYNPNPGFDAEEVIGKKDEDMLPADDARVLTEIKQKVLNSGKGSREEVRTTIKGKPFFSQLVTEPLSDLQGNIIGITCASIDITEFRQVQQKLESVLDATINTISNVIETRDSYTSGHQDRVTQLSVSIALELELPREKVKGIKTASLIHDIGKIGIPSEILSKPTKLSDIEFSLIKEHPQTGYNILKSIDFSYPVAQIILQHHERIDGSGYPNGLKDDDILLEAKIIGVADVVEAMSSHRPYRVALGIEAALEEITKNKGILYDPKIVDVCVKLFKEKGFEFE